MNGQIILGSTLLLLGVVLYPIIPLASYIVLALAFVVAVVDYFFEV